MTRNDAHPQLPMEGGGSGGSGSGSGVYLLAPNKLNRALTHTHTHARAVAVAVHRRAMVWLAHPACNSAAQLTVGSLEALLGLASVRPL